MEFLNADKRVSLALIISSLAHAALVAMLVWRGGVFSPTSISAASASGPIDFLDSAVRAQPAPLRKPSKRAAVASQLATEPRSETDVAVKSDIAPTANANPAENALAQDASSTSMGRDAGEMARYVGLLVEAVQKNRRYPKDAIDREEEGVVGLQVKLGSNGDLIEAAVKKPCPFTSLNEAALKTLQSIPHFPKPPIADGTVIELAIPMRFKIERL